jgi:hypothetical protein
LVSALGFFAWGSSASAQVDVGPQIRIDVGGGSKAASETSIASSNVNANVIVAAWNDWRESTPNEEKVRIGVAVSNDGGANWSDFLIHAQETIESIIECDPMTAYDDRTGTLWVGGIAAGGNGGVFVTSKIPGQAAFVDPPIIAYERNDDDPYGAVDKGWMAAGPRPGYPEETNVYIVFIRVMPFYQGVIVRSMDMGVHWSLMGEDWEPEPYALATADAFLPRVGPNGEVYVVYSGPSAAPPRDKGIYLRRSFNGGESFGEEITIATFIDTWLFSDNLAISGTFRAPSFSYFAVDQNNGTLYCVYFDTTNFVGGNRNVDLYFTKSTNQGATGSWTTPVVINGDGDPPGDQFFPWIEVDEESNLHMVFLDSRHTVQDDDEEHGMLDAYYSFSNDGGATWQEFRLTEDSFDSDDDGLNWLTGEQVLGDYMGLGRSQDQVYPCYPSTQDGDTDIYTHVITVLGGCCVDDSCDLVSRESCESQNGTFLGAGKTCTLPDCNCNGAADPCDIANATSEDLDDNGVPDECDDKGACCLSYDPNDCVMTPTSECCDALHGVYWYEPHAKCETTDCSQAPMQPQP